MSAPTPLLDFFKRGEAARDVRLLAAAGALTPRAVEQIAILVWLLDDSDPDVRSTAQQTVDRIPIQALTGLLARSDVPIGVREFFAARGILPDEIPGLAADDPLVDTEVAGPEGESVETEGAPHESLVHRIARMSFPERLKAAVKGTREMRAILIRDPSKVVAASVLSSARLTDSEVETFARMANVAEDVLRIIATNRAWTKNYGIVVALTRNPKTPLGLSLNLMSRLSDRDVSALAMDRNVPDALRTAARRKTAL